MSYLLFFINNILLCGCAFLFYFSFLQLRILNLIYLFYFNQRHYYLLQRVISFFTKLKSFQKVGVLLLTFLFLFLYIFYHLLFFQLFFRLEFILNCFNYLFLLYLPLYILEYNLRFFNLITMKPDLYIIYFLLENRLAFIKCFRSKLFNGLSIYLITGFNRDIYNIIIQILNIIIIQFLLVTVCNLRIIQISFRASFCLVVAYYSIDFYLLLGLFCLL